MLALTLLSGRVHADTTLLYGTYTDWTCWNGTPGASSYTVQAVSNFNYGNLTVNGVGDTNLDSNSSSVIGETSMTGALEISPVSPFSWWGPTGDITAQGGQSNAFFVAIDGTNGSTAGLASHSGSYIVDFTMPDDSLGGSYFHMGIFKNYSGGWGWNDASSQIDLGPVSTPSGTEEMYEAIIPYDLAACTFGYWDTGFLADTDYSGTNNWYITSWSVVIPPPPCQQVVNTLFATSNDFAQCAAASGASVQTDGTWYETNNFIINGDGNTNAGGGTGLSGSLSVTWDQSMTRYGNIVELPQEDGNSAFLLDVDTASSLSVSAYGNIYIDYTQPDTTGGGSYFQLGVGFVWPGSGWYDSQQFFSSKVEDLGYADQNGDELNRATIPYTLVAGSYMSWDFVTEIWVNSDYSPANPFHIANISVSSSAAPTLSISSDGTTVTINGTGGIGGDTYTVFKTTDLTKPVSQWSIVGTPGLFGGPCGFSVTDTMDPNGSVYYCAQAGH